MRLLIIWFGLARLCCLKHQNVLQSLLRYEFSWRFDLDHHFGWNIWIIFDCVIKITNDKIIAASVFMPKNAHPKSSWKLEQSFWRFCWIFYVVSPVSASFLKHIVRIYAAHEWYRIHSVGLRVEICKFLMFLSLFNLISYLLYPDGCCNLLVFSSQNVFHRRKWNLSKFRRLLRVV